MFNISWYKIPKKIYTSRGTGVKIGEVLIKPGEESDALIIQNCKKKNVLSMGNEPELFYLNKKVWLFSDKLNTTVEFLNGLKTVLDYLPEKHAESWGDRISVLEHICNAPLNLEEGLCGWKEWSKNDLFLTSLTTEKTSHILRARHWEGRFGFFVETSIIYTPNPRGDFLLSHGVGRLDLWHNKTDVRLNDIGMLTNVGKMLDVVEPFLDNTEWMGEFRAIKYLNLPIIKENEIIQEFLL